MVRAKGTKWSDDSDRKQHHETPYWNDETQRIDH